MQVNGIKVKFKILIDKNTSLEVDEDQARLLFEKLAEVFGVDLDGEDDSGQNVETLKKILEEGQKKGTPYSPDSTPWQPVNPYQPVWVYSPTTTDNTYKITYTDNDEESRDYYFNVNLVNADTDYSTSGETVGYTE